MRYTEIIVENFDADDDLFGDAHPILRAIKLLTKLKPVVKRNPQAMAELMDSIKDKDQVREQVLNFMAQSLHMTREYFDHQAEDLSMLPTQGNWYTRPWEFWNVQALDHEIKTLVRFRESRHFFNEEESDKDMFGTSNRGYNELIENDVAVADDELFGKPKPPSDPSEVLNKFKLIFRATKRVAMGNNAERTSDRAREIFNLVRDKRYSASKSYDRHSYWNIVGFSNRENGFGLLIYRDSGNGDSVYFGAANKAELEKMMQAMIDIGAIESPAGRRARLAAKSQSRMDRASAKGIQVGTKIRMRGPGHDVTVEVIGFTSGGKLKIRMLDGPNAGKMNTWQPSPASIKKDDIISENDESDDELFGNSPRVQISQWLTGYANSMRSNPGDLSGFGPEDDEYNNEIEEILQQADELEQVARIFSTHGVEKGLQAFSNLARDNEHNWWWDTIAMELFDETDISLEDLANNAGIDESDEHDDADMFGTSERVKRNLDQANFRVIASQFVQELRNIVDLNTAATAKEIVRELNNASRIFKAFNEDLLDLSEYMIDHDVPGVLHTIAQWIGQDISRVNNEDALYDYLSNVAENIRHESELWGTIQEVMEEGSQYDGDNDETEYSAAMVVSGEITNLLLQAIPQAFALAKAAYENQ